MKSAGKQAARAGWTWLSVQAWGRRSAASCTAVHNPPCAGCAGGARPPAPRRGGAARAQRAARHPRPPPQPRPAHPPAHPLPHCCCPAPPPPVAPGRMCVPQWSACPVSPPAGASGPTNFSSSSCFSRSASSAAASAFCSSTQAYRQGGGCRGVQQRCEGVGGGRGLGVGGWGSPGASSAQRAGRSCPALLHMYALQITARGGSPAGWQQEPCGR